MPSGTVTPPANELVARGMRDFNPLNLNYYPGQVGLVGRDAQFGQYANMAQGVAANVNQLLINQGRGLNTVRKQVQRWVSDPKADLDGYGGSDNPNPKPGSYIYDVAHGLGVGPDEAIDVHNPLIANRFVSSAQPHESGPSKLDPKDVTQGVAMALTGQPTGNQLTAQTAPAPVQAPTPAVQAEPAPGPVQAPTPSGPNPMIALQLLQLALPNHRLEPVDYDPWKIAAKTTGASA
jgi:hypothetical protein